MLRKVKGLFLLLTVLCLVACGKKEETVSLSLSQIQEEHGTIFLERELEISGIKGYGTVLCIGGDMLYVYTSDYDRETGSVSNHLYAVPAEGGEAAEIDYGDKSREIVSMVYDGEKLLALANLYDYETKSGNTALLTIYPQDYYCEVKENEVPGEEMITCVSADGEGRRYYLAGNKIYVCSDGGEEFVISGEDSENIVKCFANGSGEVLAVLENGDNYTVKKIDAAKKGFGGESAAFKLGSYSFDNTFTPGTGAYDFYFVKDGTAYAYSFADGKEREIIDYLQSDIVLRNVTAQQFADDGTLYMLSNTGKGGVRLFTRADPSEIKEKTVLTLVLTHRDEDHFSGLISEFNALSRDYKVVVKSYGQDPETGASRFSLDTAMGEAADIYDVAWGVGDVSIAKCISLGLFEDLTPYYEKDEEVNKEDVLPGVYKAISFDGNPYFTVSEMGIMTLAVPRDKAGDIKGWTVPEITAFAEKNGGASKLFGSSNGSYLFDRLYDNVASEHIDISAKKCSFDSESFINFMEFCWSAGSGSDLPGLEADEYLNGDILLYPVTGSGPSELLTAGALFGGNAVYPGYPEEDGNGNFLSFEIRFAMAANSKNKEGAWEFMKYCMSREYCGSSYMNSFYFPVRKDIFELYMSSLTAKEEYEDEFGNIIYPYNMSAGYNGFDIELGPLDASQEKMLRELVDNTDKMFMSDQNINIIIYEESRPFFSGDKSAEEVCGIINNRVETYLNENY